MAFDFESFKMAKYEKRTKFYPFPELKKFFGKGEKPGFLLKGLTSVEYAQVDVEVAANKKIPEIVEKIVSNTGRDIGEAVHELLGLGDNVPDEIAKRIAIFMKGVVEPAGTLELAKTIAERFAMDFYAITNDIVELTNSGFEVKKIEILWESPKVKEAITICYLRGGYLYKHFPRIIPDGECSDVEIGLWNKFYQANPKLTGIKFE